MKFIPATILLFSMTWRAITWLRANKCSLSFFSSSSACFWLSGSPSGSSERKRIFTDRVSHGFLYNWIGKLFLPSAWLGHSLIFYNFITIHLKLIKFDENMVLWLVNQNFEKNQVLMYHFSSNACLRKLNLNLREKKSWFSNACNFLRKTFSNLLKHELYFN